MRKYTWIIVAIVTLLSACQPEPLQTEDFVVTPAPTLPTLSNRPAVTAELTDILRGEIAWTLDVDSYTAVEFDNGEVEELLKLYLVSAGVFDTAEITLANGEKLKFDLVYAYQLNHAREVLTIPLVMGMETADGRYTYFSDSYIYSATFDPAEFDPGVLTRISRADALRDAEMRLPAGALFVVSIAHLSDRNHIDWQACPHAFYVDMSGEFCQAGSEIDQGYASLMIQRAATSLPDGWMLVGWFFSETTDILDIQD